MYYIQKDVFFPFASHYSAVNVMIFLLILVDLGDDARKHSAILATWHWRCWDDFKYIFL